MFVKNDEGMDEDMKKIQLKNKQLSLWKQGYPLIKEIDLVRQADSSYTGEWLEFVTRDSKYIGTGYLGEQNKGIGWIINWNQGQPINQAFFEEKFLQAKKLRQSYFLDELTTAFRIFNGEGDGVGGLTIDWYDHYLVIQWYNESIYQKQPMILAAIQAVYPEVLGIYEKNRFTQAGLATSQHVAGQLAKEPLIVKENGVNYSTYLDDGMMTGIFLDQKNVRGQLVDGLAMGKTVLNTFSYTGAFSVAAAMGGAVETTSVDLAKRSIEKTQEMFQVNGLPLEDHSIVVMDVFEYYRYAKRKGLSYDCIILDPPSFARNKKKTFSVAKDYGTLVMDALPILNQQGLLIASTNAANVSEKKFRQMIEQGMSQMNRSYKLLKEERLPSDFQVNPAFTEGNYLKVFIYQLDK